MLSIHTKFIEASNVRGARVKAHTLSYGLKKGFSVTVPYNDSLDYYKAHFEAVKALIKKHNLDWNLDGMRFGDSADGNGFTFCFDRARIE